MRLLGLWKSKGLSYLITSVIYTRKYMPVMHGAYRVILGCLKQLICENGAHALSYYSFISYKPQFIFLQSKLQKLALTERCLFPLHLGKSCRAAGTCNPISVG
jgi:hypothetical protein